MTTFSANSAERTFLRILKEIAVDIKAGKKIDFDAREREAWDAYENAEGVLERPARLQLVHRTDVAQDAREAGL